MAEIIVELKITKRRTDEWANFPDSSKKELQTVSKWLLHNFNNHPKQLSESDLLWRLRESSAQLQEDWQVVSPHHTITIGIHLWGRRRVKKEEIALVQIPRV